MPVTRRHLIFVTGACVLVLAILETVVHGRTPTVQTGYVTAFRTSYFTNGELFESFLFLVVGVFVAVVSISGRKGRERAGWAAIIFMFVWCCVWIPTWTWFALGTLMSGYRYTTALRDNKCRITEGVVHVLHEEPASGHSAGDRIQIDGQQFEYSYFTATIGYNRTISHGGVLTEGAKVRVYSLDGAILRIDVHRQDQQQR